MTQRGGCHCGRIAFEVEGEIDQVVIECNCTHCSRKGLLLWFVPRSRFHLITPENHLSTYLFNRRVIRHQFCSVCGTQPFAYGKDPGGAETAAINVRCLPDVDRTKLEIVPFDGLHKL